MQAANGTAITTYGAHIVPLRFGGRIFQARLIAADVKRSLLGDDFLLQHNLQVDIRNHRLIEADTFSGISCSISSATTNHLALVEPTSNKFRKVLNEFPDLLKPTFSTAVVKHGVQHFIPTKDRPVFARARRLAPEKLKIAKAEFLEMEKMGIIQKSSSPWASPLHMVSKHVATTVNLTTSPHHIDTQFPTFRTFRLISRTSQFFQRSTWFRDTTKYQSPQKTFLRPQSLHLSVCGNFCECLLD